MKRKIIEKITAKRFDEKFDNNENIDDFLDFSTAIRLKRLKTETKKVNVDFPEWIINSLDEEAKKIGVVNL
ncbi:type II toxin-antitoxin system BrnA family antitoxin [Sulfurimonas sp.]|uniref:type II toxin-antitoxin system BrnA family antitoxin n=1 Tax=Sulfurimonas sp. TaxID=2022749 RepID=UPI002B49F1CA|nr:CopG family transcriptional regulator [Sulfurimonas sp.]